MATSSTDPWSGLIQQITQGLVNNIGAGAQSGADPTAAYPTYSNPYGIGSGSAGTTPANSTPQSPTATNASPTGAPNTTMSQSAPLIGSSPAPVGNQSNNPTTGSQSYNPWDLKGQANVRSF